MLKFTGLLAELLVQFVKFVELLRLDLKVLQILLEVTFISTMIFVFSFALVLPLQVQYV